MGMLMGEGTKVGHQHEDKDEDADGE